MNQGLYELLALCARYIFAGLMILIVARAWRITIVDSRRAKTLRRISPETGIIGELMVMEGDEKARRGMKYKVIREGQIGSARRADIRVRHSSVRRRHAYFLLTEDGLRIRSHAGAPLRDENGRPAREIILRDGDNISIGRVQLMLILSQASGDEGVHHARRRHIRRDSTDNAPDMEDDLFETDSFEPRDDLFPEFDTGYRPAPPVRRHLPFSVEEGPAMHRDIRRPAGDRPVRSPRYSNADFGVEDNPLNRRRPQNTQTGSGISNTGNIADDDEMW